MPTIVSHSKKIIFFHIPKTAGTTLCSNILEYDKSFVQIEGSVPDSRIFDGTVKIHESLLNKCGINANDYYKFTVIRHPLDRFWSSYQMMCKDINFEQFVDYALSAKMPHKFYTEIAREARTEYQDFIWHSYISQYDHCLNNNNQFFIDQIITFENLKSDIDQLVKYLGLNPDISRNLNNSVYGKYESLYTIDTKNKIKNFFRKDFDFFGFNYVSKL